MSKRQRPVLYKIRKHGDRDWRLHQYYSQAAPDLDGLTIRWATSFPLLIEGMVNEGMYSTIRSYHARANGTPSLSWFELFGFKY